MKFLFALLMKTRKDWAASALGGVLLAIAAIVTVNKYFGPLEILGAKSGLVFSQDELYSARQAARRATDELEGFLRYSRHRNDWNRYLQLGELHRQLDYEGDVERLREILDLFSQPHSGLEMPEFANVRFALSTYLKMLEHSAEPVERVEPLERAPIGRAEYLAGRRRRLR